MPLYEYECTACHRRTEKIQKFSDPEITVCPFCNGHLERVLTAPAVTFKGGGWYADGYGNAKPAAKTSESSGGGSNAAAASTGGASESKSESKSEAKPAASAPAAAPAAPAAAKS
jgi:putative FmdB family regulatory protein